MSATGRQSSWKMRGDFSVGQPHEFSAELQDLRPFEATLNPEGLIGEGIFDNICPEEYEESEIASLPKFDIL